MAAGLARQCHEIKRYLLGQCCKAQKFLVQSKIEEMTVLVKMNGSVAVI